MKIKLPRIKIAPYDFFKGLFIVIFIAACAIVLIPQIDYQPWYPQILGTHDFNLGLEFKDHKVATVSSNEQELPLISTVYKRLSDMKLEDTIIEKSNGQLSAHFSSDQEDSLIQNIFGNGLVEIYKPNNPSEITSDPSKMFDLNNYQKLDFDISKITEAKVTQTKDAYAYISIRTDATEQEKWDATATALNDANVMVLVDGGYNIGWMLSSTQSGGKFPLLVILGDRSQASLLASELTGTALQRADTLVTVTTTQPLAGENLIYFLLIFLLAEIAIGLAFRAYKQKERLSSISMVAVTVLGLLTVMKLLPITLSLLTIVTGIIIIGALLFTKSSKYILIGASFAFMGILLNLSGQYAFHSVAYLLIASGIYTLIFYSISYLFGIYEEK